MARFLDDNGIRGIVFDSYGTLFNVQSVMERCDQMFPGEGRELAILWRRKQLEYTWLLSLMERYEDFWKVTDRALLFAVKALEIPLTHDQKEALLNATLDLEYFTEVGQAISDLASYRLAILSNGSPLMLKALADKNGFANTFDAIISADEVRTYKPDPRVYRLAERKLGLVPERLLLVSAHSFDVNGAKACGMQACWVNRKGGQWDSLGFLPDMTVGDLRELVEILNA